MNSLMVFTFVCLALTVSAGELPQQEEDAAALEIEPPLLIKTRATDGSPLDAAPSAAADVQRLQTAVARAKQSAASAERLFKAGILARVEAEERALRVVRLEADLAEAELESAKHEATIPAQSGRPDPVSPGPASGVESVIAQALETARVAVAARDRAELAAAAANLERQRKLFALGSGRKADLNRAEEKLAELKARDH
ncbi:MAG: hypothetical protein ABI871_04500 [Chthoniobacterales bacterium]